MKQYDGIEFRLISCDLIEFCPQLVAEKGKIGGFIIAENKLYSEAGFSGTDGQNIPNVVLEGTTGNVFI